MRFCKSILAVVLFGSATFGQVPCSSITRNPLVLEALIDAELSHGADLPAESEAVGAVELGKVKFEPFIVKRGDALYLEYKGNEFHLRADFASGDAVEFVPPPKATNDQWRRGVLLLDLGPVIEQRLIRLSVARPSPVQFRTLRLVRAGQPIFEFMKLSDRGRHRLRAAVHRQLPCSSEVPPFQEAALALPAGLRPGRAAFSPMRAEPMTAATMFQAGGGGSSATHYKFTGKEQDSESGLYNYGARYYSPLMGRFLSPDWSAKPVPIPYADLRNPQTLNLYSYANNNPLRYNDPDGHCGAPSGLQPGQTGICIASFIQADRIMVIGRGDGRGPNPHGGTSRIETRLIVENGKVTKTDEIVGRSGLFCKECGFKGSGQSTVSNVSTDDLGNTSLQVSQTAQSSMAAGGRLLGEISNHINLEVTADQEVAVMPGSTAKDYPSIEIYSYTTDGKTVTATLVLHKQESKSVDLKKDEKPLPKDQ